MDPVTDDEGRTISTTSSKSSRRSRSSSPSSSSSRSQRSKSPAGTTPALPPPTSSYVMSPVEASEENVRVKAVSRSKRSKSPAGTSSEKIRTESDILVTPPEFTSYSGIMQSSLEKELIDANYAPLQKLIINNDDQKELYIKAIDLNGNCVFVRITKFGYVADKNNKALIKLGDDAELIPLSVRIGAYECTSKLICGVAFECDSGVCVVRESDIDDPNPSTVNYALIDDKAMIAGKEDLYTILPIINFEDIKSDPETILEYTQSIVDLLRKIVWSKLVEDANYFHHCLMKATNENNALRTLVGQYKAKIYENLAKLQALNKQWKGVQLNNDLIKVRHANFLRTRRIYIDRLQILFAGLQKLNSLQEHIDIIDQTIDSVRTMFIENFN